MFFSLISLYKLISHPNQVLVTSNNALQRTLLQFIEKKFRSRHYFSKLKYFKDSVQEMIGMKGYFVFLSLNHCLLNNVTNQYSEQLSMENLISNIVTRQNNRRRCQKHKVCFLKASVIALSLVTLFCKQ